MYSPELRHANSEMREADNRFPAYLVFVIAVLISLSVWISLFATRQFERQSLASAITVSVAVHAFVVSTSRDLQFDKRQILTPLNWLNLAWYAQLVVIPSIVCLQGPEDLSLSIVPSFDDMARAVLITLGGFLAYALVVSTVTSRYGGLEARVKAPPTRRYSALTIGSMAFIGLLALAYRFGTPGRLWQYFSGEVTAALRPSTPVGLLVPLLGMAGVLVACNATAAGTRVLRSYLLAGVLIAFGFGTNGYNRSMVAVCVLALVYTYSVHYKRISFSTVLVGGFAGGWALVQVGARRSEYLHSDGGRLSLEALGYQPDRFTDLLAQLQIYVRAPQYAAAVPRAVDRGVTLNVDSIMASVLSPIPILGAPFRENLTSIPYSAEVRGMSGAVDISPSFIFEMFWALGIAGALLAGMVIGLLAIGHYFIHRANFGPFVHFLNFAMVLWTGSLLASSVSVFSQAVVQLGIPVAVAVVIIGAVHSVRTRRV